jgi:hypothetical protein
MEMKPVDPASIAHLNGIFAPIQDEIDVGPLEVVQGSFPREHTGIYPPQWSQLPLPTPRKLHVSPRQRRWSSTKRLNL